MEIFKLLNYHIKKPLNYKEVDILYSLVSYRAVELGLKTEDLEAIEEAAADSTANMSANQSQMIQVIIVHTHILNMSKLCRENLICYEKATKIQIQNTLHAGCNARKTTASKERREEPQLATPEGAERVEDGEQQTHQACR